MKRGIGVGLVVWALAGPACAAEVDVFLLGGQSNMQGSGQVAELPEGLAGPVADTFFWNGKAFEPLVIGTTQTANKPGRFGPEVGFVLGMREAAARPRYLVKFAAGGMPLHHGWDWGKWVGGPPQPGRASFYPGESADDANQGSAYRMMLARFRDALDAIRAQGDTPVVRGFLWMQGEADANVEESARSYAASLRLLRDRLASDLGLEGLPIVFGQALPHDQMAARFAYRDVLRGRMSAADGRSGGSDAIPQAVMVSTDGMGLEADMLHYDTAGQLQLGRAFARATGEVRKP